MIRSPSTSIRSLTSSGTPASRPLTPARARASARSPFVTMTALRSARASIAASASSTTSTGSSSPRPTSSAISTATLNEGSDPYLRVAPRISVSEADGDSASASVTSSISAGPPQVRARCSASGNSAACSIRSPWAP